MQESSNKKQIHISIVPSMHISNTTVLELIAILIIILVKVLVELFIGIFNYLSHPTHLCYLLLFDN